MAGRALGLVRLLPPVVWMGVIAILSGDLLSAEATGSRLLPTLVALFPDASPRTIHGLHALVRKLGHLVEYGILAALWLHALRPGRSARAAARWAMGLAVLYAGFDEMRQGLAPARSPSVVDVGVDALGAFLAVAALEGSGGLSRGGFRLLRWAAAAVAGGSLAWAVVDWSLGLPAGDLWAAAALAAAVTWGLGRLSRRWPPEAA